MLINQWTPSGRVLPHTETMEVFEIFLINSVEQFVKFAPTVLKATVRYYSESTKNFVCFIIVTFVDFEHVLYLSFNVIYIYIYIYIDR